MKMIDFGWSNEENLYGGANGSEITQNYFGTSSTGLGQCNSGILNNILEDNGYPQIADKPGADSNVNLEKVFNEPNVDARPRIVNHLFLKSVYESSGYFEFDSAQNFAV